MANFMIAYYGGNPPSSEEEDKDPDAMKGFTVVKTKNIVAAVEIAKSDPFLANGGTLRISEMMEMG